MLSARKPIAVMLAGGGTGGHLFPAIAVAQELQRRHPEWRNIFVGTARGIEVRAVPANGFELELLQVQPLRGRGLMGMLRGLWAVPMAVWHARSLIRRHHIAVAVGVGGYAAGPALLAAVFLRVPTVIMEQNAHAGFTNRVLARLCNQVLLAMPNKQLGGLVKAQVLGNPVRRELVALGERPRPYPERFTAERPLRLLVVGGSQGAHALNQAILNLLPRLKGLPVRMHHQTGKSDWAMVQERYRAVPEVTAQVAPFIDDMAQAYGDADVLVCRSGASTLAELAVVGLPAVFVPYPSAADDHQTANAQVMVAAGGGVLLPESKLCAEALLDLLRPWLESPARLGEMAQNARKLGKPEAVMRICDRIEAELTHV